MRVQVADQWTTKFIRWLMLPVFMAAALGSAVLSPARADSSIEVTTFDGGTEADDGQCSLLEAITNANDNAATHDDCAAGSGNDTITFANALGSGSVVLSIQLPAIADANGLTIDGGGDVTVDGANTWNGFHVTGGNATFQNITIKDGTTAYSGGGLLLSSPATALVDHVTFQGNDGTTGGAIFNPSTLTVKNSTFDGNSAGSSGGGAIYADDSASTVIINSTFSNNSTTAAGGALMVDTSTALVYNSTFSGNSAPASNGAAVQIGGGILFLYNSILANSSSGDDCVITGFGASFTGNNNLIEDSTPACGVTDGTNGSIVGVDPALGSAMGPAPLYFPLTNGSSAIDAGSNADVPGGVTTDQAGNSRFVDIPWKADTGSGTAPIVDMGSYEATISCPGGVRLYVDADATGDTLGTSWTDAFPDLQMALHTVAECGTPTEVWVAEGVYKPAVYSSVLDRFVSFDIPPGVAVHGGFAGTETELDQCDPVANLTILSGDIDSNDTNLDGNNVAENYSDALLNNSYHVVTIDGTTTDADSNTVLHGVTVTAAIADAGGNNNQGGGLWCKASTGLCSPVISHVTFSGNQAGFGGGAWLDGSNNGTSSPWFTDTTFVGNHASGNGGGMLNYSSGTGASSPTFSNVTIKDNSAGGSGGGMLNAASGGTSSPSLTNVTFDSNSAGTNGGGMWSFAYNTGGVTNPTLTNVTFFNNSASVGGAMNNMVADTGNAHAELTNVILWGDSATTNAEIDNSGGASITISYSVVAGGCAAVPNSTCGSGNVSTDPMMAALANNGGSVETKAILSGSSALNTGYNPSCSVTDARGMLRPRGPGCDMGAYEHTWETVADIDGDADSDIGVYRSGMWYVKDVYSIPFGGVPGDIPLPADYDGDNNDDRGIFRSGMWFIAGLFDVAYGTSGDIPVPADYDGDGDVDLAVFRGGIWYVKDLFTVAYGAPGDIPVPGDYDGDGDTDIAVYRSGMWYVKDGTSFAYGGVPSDIPVPADYDGDGDVDGAVFRDGMWYIRNLTSHAYGAPGDIPIPGDYDGNGTSDIAAFRAGMWYIKDQTSVPYGAPGDFPLPAPDTDGDGDPYQ